MTTSNLINGIINDLSRTLTKIDEYMQAELKRLGSDFPYAETFLKK